MKKCLLLLLCLTLTLTLAQSACAAPAAGDASLVLDAVNMYESARSACWVGDTLYLLTNGGLYAWQAGGEPALLMNRQDVMDYDWMEQPPEDEQARALWEQSIDFLFTDGERLMALQQRSGQAFVWQNEGWQAAARLPGAYLSQSEGGSLRGVYGYAFASGRLYLLQGSDDPEKWDKTTLICFDPVTGEAAELDAHGARQLAAGAAGKLLLGVPNELDDNTVIWQYDIQTAALEKETERVSSQQLMGGLLAVEGQLTLCQPGEVITLSDGVAQVRAYVPVGLYGGIGQAVCSASGLYALPMGRYVFVRDIKGEAAAQTVLRLRGTVDPDLLVRFSIANPDLAVVSLPDADAGAGLSALTDDGNVDLYLVNAPGLFTAMKEKGYAADISGSAALTDKARALYPAIQDVVFDGDRLLAYPLNMLPASWTVNETLWEQFGLGQLPRTYQELLDCLDRWQDEYAADNPDYVLCDLQLDQASCVTMIVKEYLLQHETADAAFSFDTPEFKSAVQAVIDHRALFEASEESYGSPLIFSYNLGFGITYNDSDRVRMLLPPALSTDAPQAMAANLTLLTVSAASAHKEQALRFIAFCAENLTATTNYMMNPALTEPIRPTNYEARLEVLKAELADLEAQKASAQDQDAVEDAIAAKQAQISRQESENWLISAPSVENYRETARNLVIPYQSRLLSDNGLEALSEIIQRYCGQGLDSASLPAFIGEMNRVAAMVSAEQ